MDAALDYDTTNFMVLRQELKLLNESALASGLIAARDGRPVMPTRARRGGAQGAQPMAATVKAGKAGASKSNAAGKAKAPKSGSKALAASAEPVDVEIGKAGATRLLAMAGRVAGDESPDVPGTDFTEAGIVRLLAHLRKRRSRGFHFLQRVYRFLTRPSMMGTHTSAGISVERLQLVSRQLHEIEAEGWQHFRTVNAARRGARHLTVAAPRSAIKPPAAGSKAIKSTAKPKPESGTRRPAAKREIS